MPPWLSSVERRIGNAEVVGSNPIGGFYLFKSKAYFYSQINFVHYLFTQKRNSLY